MSLRVELHPKAELDIAEIGLYLIERSIDAARHFPDAVDEMLRRLADYPLIGRERPELAAGLRALPVHGFRDYLIFYQVRADTIEIVRVIHGAMHLEDQFGA